MTSEKMKPLVENNSAIRATLEEGKRLAGIYGGEHIYGFSLGNPNVPAPKAVKQAIFDILSQEESTSVYGYMSNAGFEDVREAVATSLNRRFGTSFHLDNILTTVGAASRLNVILKTILNPREQVVVFASYFVKCSAYVRNYDGGPMVAPPDIETFQPNLEAFASMIGEKTRTVIINMPDNPTSVICSEETLRWIADILCAKEEKCHVQIVLISDEPYRELVYDGAVVPYVTKHYRDTIVCYSYSESLSLPGERIGYLVILGEMQGSKGLSSAACIASRVLGRANTPSLIQRVILRCVDEETNVGAYDRNRNLLYSSLTDYGFTCIKPGDAFYLFMKTPGDEVVFYETCKKHHVLVIPGSSFARPGCVRIAYCVPCQQIERSLPVFQAIAREYGLSGGC